jgi:hypothetical protein
MVGLLLFLSHLDVRACSKLPSGMFGIGDSQNYGDPDPNRYFTVRGSPSKPLITTSYFQY